MRHKTICQPDSNATTALMKDFAHGSTYNPAKLRYMIAVWCARRTRPYHLVNDPEFVEILQMFNAQVAIPSRMTVSRDVKRVFELTKKSVQELLAVSQFFVFLATQRAHLSIAMQKQESAMHLGIDGWTSPNHFSFIGITIHFVQNGSLAEFTLEFAK
jgi:phenylalanine-4-hydroxylase